MYGFLYDNVSLLSEPVGHFGPFLPKANNNWAEPGDSPGYWSA